MNIFRRSDCFKGFVDFGFGIGVLEFYLLDQEREIADKTVLYGIEVVNDLFFIGAVGLNLMCESTSRVYFWLELTMSIMTSILNWVGLILSACILAYFMIILSGFVLVL